MEIYVLPLDGKGRRMTLSGGGAAWARSSRDGRELFYLAGNRLMVTPIKTSPTIVLGEPVLLFTLPPDARWTDYDVSIDGKRLLAVVPQIRPNQLPINVIVNWTARQPQDSP